MPARNIPNFWLNRQISIGDSTYIRKELKQFKKNKLETYLPSVYISYQKPQPLQHTTNIQDLNRREWIHIDIVFFLKKKKGAIPDNSNNLSPTTSKEGKRAWTDIPLPTYIYIGIYLTETEKKEGV